MSRGVRVAIDSSSWAGSDDGCSILHVDMDAFFAMVELARRPHLRGLPVIVGGRERGVVLSATYEARAMGVRAALPMSQALRMCPKAVVISPDHDAYREVSRGVMEVLRNVTTLVEQVSVDEAFLDISGARRRLGSASVIGEQIRATVATAFGVTCSVGAAASKSVAKLASGMAKPDGMLVVPGHATVSFLHQLPVSALWGVGEKTQQQLARWGITTVEELATSDKALVQRAVGKTAGAHLHDLAWGRDLRPVTPGREEKSVGAEHTFMVDVRAHDVLESKLGELSDRCASRLRRLELVARTVAIKVRTDDFVTVSRSRSLGQPTDVGREIFLTARELLAGVELSGRAVRLVGVRTEGLQRATSLPTQLTLDEAIGGVGEKYGGRRAAEVAVDQIRQRFGTAAVRSGLPPVSTTAVGCGELS